MAFMFVAMLVIAVVSIISIMTQEMDAFSRPVLTAGCCPVVVVDSEATTATPTTNRSIGLFVNGHPVRGACHKGTTYGMAM